MIQSIIRQTDLIDDFELATVESGEVIPSAALQECNSPRKVPDNFYKGVAAIHAMPLDASQSLSLNQRRLFDAILLLVGLETKRWEPEYRRRVKTDRISPLFEVKTKTLMQLAGITGKNYQRLYSDLDALLATPFLWNILGEQAEVTWEMKANLISTFGIGRNGKLGLLRFGFTPDVLDILIDPMVWGKFSTSVMAKLTTAPAYSLYQSVFRYVGTYHKLTAALPVVTWMRLLVAEGQYLSRDTKGAYTATNYKDFKRRVIEKALTQINAIEELPYSLSLIEHTLGRRVLKLQFAFKLKQSAQPDVATQGIKTPPLSPLDQSLLDLGFSREELSNLKATYTAGVLTESLSRLHTATASLSQKGRGVSSAKAYLAGIAAKITNPLEKPVNPSLAGKTTKPAEEDPTTESSRRQLKQLKEWLLSEPEGLTSLTAEFLQHPTGLKSKKLIPSKTGQLDFTSIHALIPLRFWLIENHPELCLIIFKSA